MASIAFFQMFTLLCIYSIVNADKTTKPYKKWRKYIDCEVCRVSMSWLYKLSNQLREEENTEEYGEYEIENLMHQMCRSQTNSGEWIRTLDIAFNKSSGDIELKLDGKKSECNRNCKAIELSCKHIIEMKTDKILKFIWTKYKINEKNNDFHNDLVYKMCNEECTKYLKWRKSGKLMKAMIDYDIGDNLKNLRKEELNELKAQNMKNEQLEQIKQSVVKTAERFRYKTSVKNKRNEHRMDSQRLKAERDEL